MPGMPFAQLDFFFLYPRLRVASKSPCPFFLPTTFFPLSPFTMDASDDPSAAPGPARSEPSPIEDLSSVVCADCQSRSNKVHMRKCIQAKVTVSMIDSEASLPGATKVVSVLRSEQDKKFRCPQINCTYSSQNAGGITAHMASCAGNMAGDF